MTTNNDNMKMIKMTTNNTIMFDNDKERMKETNQQTNKTITFKIQ